MSEERPGLLETAARARGHYQKRAYACVKLLVGVMCRAPAAVRAVHHQHDARRRWRQLLAWLQDELDRVTILTAHTAHSAPHLTGQGG